MKKRNALAAGILCAALVCLAATGRACGYDFVGGCSSKIIIAINGTQDSFSIAPCAGNARFDGLQMGRIKTLEIVRVEGESWESCHNNVCYMQLHYRLRPKSDPAAGTWQSLQLSEYFSYEEGDYTTRFFRSEATSGLSAALTADTEYVLELYLSAEIDTIGDDFVPEIQITQNNFGQNHQCSFVYAPEDPGSMSLFVRLQQNPLCHGDSTGYAHVGVYGATSGLFFHWSDVAFNFFIRDKLPAGVYSLSVTNSLQDTAVLVFEIAQPDVLSASVGAYAPLNCGVDSLQITVQVSGGIPPWSLVWDETWPIVPDSLLVAAPGPHALALADANGCEVLFAPVLDAYVPVGVEAVVTQASLPQAADGAIALHLSGGGEPYAVVWDQGQEGEALEGLPIGLYCYTVSDAYGCETADCAEITASIAYEDPTGDAPIRAWPNPVAAGGQWIVSAAQAIHTFALYDAAGRALEGPALPRALLAPPFSQESSGTGFTLRVKAPEQPGIYFFQINYATGILFVR